MSDLKDKQTDKLRVLAKRLVEELDKGGDFLARKKAVMDFISATDEEAYVLGDEDLISLAVRSCKSRGKDLEKMFNQMAGAGKK